MQESREYVVRFGGARAVLVEIPTHIFGILIGSVAVAGSVVGGVPPDAGWWWPMLCFFALWGGFSLWELTTLVGRILRRKIAFRIDGDGITLSCPPLQVPWTEITRIVLTRDKIPSAGFPAASAGSYFYYLHLDLLPGVEPVNNHRKTDEWRLDEEELANAVAAHAPHVGVVKTY